MAALAAVQIKLGPGLRRGDELGTLYPSVGTLYPSAPPENVAPSFPRKWESIRFRNLKMDSRLRGNDPTYLSNIVPFANGI